MGEVCAHSRTPSWECDTLIKSVIAAVQDAYTGEVELVVLIEMHAIKTRRANMQLRLSLT